MSFLFGWGAADSASAPAGAAGGQPAPVGTALLLGTQSRLPVAPPATLPNAGAGLTVTYREGDVVEYFSSTLSKWIPAKVTGVTPSGTYDLDCKPDVAPGNIRRPVADATSGSVEYEVGDDVEYYGASQGKWISAKVISLGRDGRYNLDCKAEVTTDRIRRPMLPRKSISPSTVTAATGASGTVSAASPSPPSVAPSATPSAVTAVTAVTGLSIAQVKAGDSVEYFSATTGTWIPAKVLKTTGAGTIDLDCKPDVAPSKIRLPKVTSPEYKAGENVEYQSSSGAWIATTVTSVNGNGMYDLACKPDVHPDRIRRAKEAGFKVGDEVEYYGATAGKWIAAKVVKVNASGTYDLDCKPGVNAARIRTKPRLPRGSSTRMPSGTSSTLMLGAGAPVAEDRPALSRAGTNFGAIDFAVGDEVDYNSASKGWIPAVVKAVKPDGIFDLDCKPDVTRDRIRPRSRVADYAIGEAVEYYGATENRWIPAKVVSMNPNGTWDLNVKPQVQRDRIRRPPAAPASLAEQAIGAMSTFFGGGASSSAGASSAGAYPPTAPSLSRAGTAPVSYPGTLPPAGLAGGEAPVQLLRVVRQLGRWRYEVCPEGAAMLERHGERKISVVSICGLYRTGKSFLLNLLAERVQRGLPPFQVGTTMRACTEGLWLWGNSESADQASPLVVLIDCEGFGNTESDSTRDAQLMTLCALLSSVFILNTKGALTEGLFSALSFTCRFGEHIEERGNEASRPNLLWILRDFVLDTVDSQGARMTPDDYLEKALHDAPGSDAKSGKAGREVRQNLLRFFSRRGCVMLPKPAKEESQLLKLGQAPYASLLNDFRAGVEALKTRVMSDCEAAPKAVGGQLLSCVAYVALLRQLTTALNENKVLSVRGAWETVQHTSCGQLADELRASAQQALHALAAGQKMPNSTSEAQLPMTDEQLRQVLREQRHLLKEKWTKRAVGDELVRQEYWQELKESLAREEALVRQKNKRMADQQLMEALKRWQEWLNDDNSSVIAVESICREFGNFFESLPTGPSARAGKAAIDRSCQRVATVRQTLADTSKKHGEMHQEAIAWSKDAAHKEGAARTELGAKLTELQQAKGELELKKQAHSELQLQLEDANQDLDSVTRETEAAMAQAEAARAEEHELRSRQRVLSDTESSLQADLEKAKAATAKANASRLASERCARAASDAAASERRQLEVLLDQTKAEVEKLERQIAAETADMHGEHRRTEEEHAQKTEDVRRRLEEERAVLRAEKEKTQTEHERLLEQTRNRIEDERVEHSRALDSDREKHLERERRAGVLEGQVKALIAETAGLRQKVHDLEEKAHALDALPAKHAEENATLQQILAKARDAADKAGREAEERLRAQADEHSRELKQEEEKVRQLKEKRGLRAFVGRSSSLK